MEKLKTETIRRYLQKLHDSGESTDVIERKLRSVDKFVDWAHQKRYIENDFYKQIKRVIAEIIISKPPLKATNLKIKITEALNKIIFNFYPPAGGPISNFGIQHYIGFGILLIFMAILGTGLYNRFFVRQERTFAYPTSLTRAGRLLSFQGRLTDSLGNPITTATNVQYRLYNVATAGSSLYDTGTCSTTPDRDGVFNILVGGAGYSPTPPQSVCGTELPANLFAENANVYLGITVGADTEMTPRQQIANVGYAMNAETVQGFPPGTGTSTIPYINQDGDMMVAVASPGVRSSYASATFTVSSANAMVVQSAGQGDVVLQATQSGSIRLRTRGYSNVENRLSITNGGLVGIGTDTPSYLLEVNGTARINGNTTIGDSSSDTLTVNAGTTTLGGLTYTWPSSQTANYFLQTNGSGTLSWADPGASTYWSQTGGALYPKNSSVDLLIGGQATSSAKFAFTNVNSGTPTLDVVGNILVQGGGTIDARAAGTLTVGGTTQTGLTLGRSGATTSLVGSNVTLGGIGYGGASNTLSFTSALSGIIQGNGSSAPTAITGTANYLPKWSSSAPYLTATSNVYDDGTNIGIGTTSPSYKFDVSGTLRVTSTTTLGGLTYTWPGSQTANYVLATNGSGTLSWVDGTALPGSYWLQTNGSLYPKNATVDLLIGGQATSSAKFAFINVNSGNPTATIAGNLSLITPTGANPSTTYNILNGGSYNLQTSVGGDAGLTSRLFVANGGNVGVGTTNPLAKLHVEGQCVAAGTLISIRRRRRKTRRRQGYGGQGGNGDDEDEWEELLVPVEDVLPGDEVLSLNEATGEFEYQTVEKTMDKGRQNIYLLITESGKKIRTTGNHPYLAQEPEQSISGTFEVDQSNRFEDLSKDSYLAIANFKQYFILKLPKSEKRTIFTRYQHERKKFGPVLWGRSIAYLMNLYHLKNIKLILDDEYKGYEKLAKQIIETYTHQSVNLEVRSIGKNSPAHQAAYAANPQTKGQKKLTGALGVTQVAEDVLHPEFTGIRTSSSQAQKEYHRKNELSRGISEAEWTKVSDLAIGQKIATKDGWEKIVFLGKTGREQVYDLQIARTHNFIANGIVAHNTYIRGAGTTTGFSLRTADNTGADKLVVLDNGNVGIGTTSPAVALEVGGSGNVRIGGLTASTGVYTDANKTLTSTPPSSGVLGYWSRTGTTLSPSNAGDAITTSGNISTSGTGTITSSGLLTASNGLTLTTGALNLTGTSGTLTLSGLSASSINTGVNNLTFTSGNFNTTSTGINSTAVGATTPSTGAFTTLTSSGNTTLGTGASSVNTIGSTTTPGALTLHGATTLDNTFTVSGANLTSLGGNLTVSGNTITLDGNSTLIDMTGTGSLGLNTTTNRAITTGTGTTTLGGNLVLNNAASTTTFGGIAYTWPGSQATGYVLQTNGSGTLSWVASSGVGTNYWSQASGLLYPLNSTVDLAIGGTATSSAKFSFINVNSGTPTASISGNITLDAAGNIQTTKNQTLTIGGNTTGNITLSPLNGAGTVNSTGDINLSSGKAYYINNTSVLSATTLGSGVTTSSLTAVGTLSSGGIASGFGTISTSNTITGTTINGTTGINTGAGAGTQRIDSSGNLVNIGTTQLNSLTYTWPGSQSTNYFLQTNGSGTLSWADVNSAAAGTIYWTQANGLLYPKNSTVDLAIGGTATTSAKFAFINVNSGTPTATISGNLALAVPTGGSPAELLNIYNGGSFNLQTSVGGDAGLSSRLLINNNGNIDIASLNAGGLVKAAATTGRLSIATAGTDYENPLTFSNGLTRTVNAVKLGGALTAATDIPLGGYNLTFSGTGNVGIGTTAPSQKLDVVGSATVSANLTAGGQMQMGRFPVAPTAIGSGSLYYDTAQNKVYFYNGSAWTEMGAGAASFWGQTNGLLYPANSTVDLLIGGQATSSAKFAFINVNSGTPTASISGNITLNSAGVIQTTNMQPLVIGSSSTGSIQLSPKATTGLLVDGSGNVGIGTVSYSNTLTVNGVVSGTYFVDYSNSAYGLDPAGTTNFGGYSQKITGGALLAYDSGNVGIGTTAPSTKLDVNGTITTQTGAVNSNVADSSTAVGFLLATNNTLSTQGSKLLSVQNASTEKFYIDSSGNVYAAGTILSGNGMGLLMTNKSGGTVAQKALVITDSTNNSSFTTTTTPYSKAMYGVVTGVGLGVANDANGNGACDANDNCMVAYGGAVNVTIKNTTTVAKGDYVYTSDTAGSAVTSAKMFDGVIGVVTDTSTSGSGYVKMVFKPQIQVTAAASIDKGSKHNEYRILGYGYTAVGEGTSPNSNIPPRGLFYDNLSDGTKTDAANTTVGGPNQFSNPLVTSFFQSPASPFRVGLTGGQTYATSTTDNAGNTYLGSNTVNKVFYYDRTRDSSPQVQVELGLDPNWYNGVALSVATTSASFSQNDTIWPSNWSNLSNKSNPNLSTTYNGALLKVTGSYTTQAAARTIYVTIKSPTTFDWTDYNGNAGTAVSMTPGTAQALSGTAAGVSLTFTAGTKYNTGDVFKIASWFVEPSGSTRGTKTQFPERSYLVGTASSLDVIDADTQKLWMRFSQGTNYSLGADANNNPSSVSVLNGKMYVPTNGSSATGLYEMDFGADAIYRQNATNWSKSDQPISARDSTNTYNAINTSNILVNATANDVSAAVIPNQPTQNVTLSGWGYFSLSSASETVNLPYKFNGNPNIVITSAGHSSTTAPVNLASCSNASAKTVVTDTVTTTNFIARESAADATNYQCYTWTATGQVSPRQYVAAATNGGTSLINETDASVVNSADTGTMTNVVLTNKDLYTAKSGQIDIYYGVGGVGASYATNSTLTTSTTPALIPSTTTINSLTVTPGASTIDGKSNTIYIGSTQGLAVVQEKQSGATVGDGTDEQNGSVKYYTKDYISEEMVGDIRGMWPLNGTSDASVKGYTLTNNNSVTFTASGVRGTAATFNGTTQSLSNTSYSMATTGSWGAWMNFSSLPGVNSTAAALTIGTGAVGSGGTNGEVGTDGANSAGNGNKLTCMGWNGASLVDVVNSDTLTTGRWYHVVCTVDSSGVKLYVDGQLKATSTSITSISASTTVTIGRVPNSFGGYFPGNVDEPFATANVLSASQIKHMYEVGYRALQSHATTLGGGAADTNQQLGFISTGTNTVGAVGVDYNNQFMYVGLNSTTLGGLSKIDLNSDTNIKTYNSSANVPTGGTLLIDEDVNSVAVGYNLEAAGSAASGVKSMAPDNNSNATSGNFISKTTTTAESFTQAYLWAQYVSDLSDLSNLITVWASNDGGTNYYQCNLTNTDTSQSPTEYEYFCQFNALGSSLKTKFVFARGSTKTNTYLTRYGIAWVGSDAIGGAPGGNGLYTNNNSSVANGSYIEVAHNQNSSDVVSDAWIYNSQSSKWEQVDTKNSLVFGNGADGDVSITASTSMNTTAIASGRYYADGIVYRVNAPAASATSVTRYSGSDTLSNGITQGDEVLLVNLQGASGDTNDVGNYEFMRVQSVTASTLTFTAAITKTYAGTTAANQKVIVQRVPNYRNVTLTGSGSLTATAWDGLTTTPTGAAGYRTGIVAFRAIGNVTVASGTSISVNNLGYRGGDGTSSANPGESRPGTVANNPNDGGGGLAVCAAGNMNGAGGGGYGAAGTTGSASGSCTSASVLGQGGNAYGTTSLTGLFLGSGGGSGNLDTTTNWPVRSGGNGGGIIFVSANTVNISGTMSADGQTAGAALQTNHGGAGGGGGGSVYVLSNNSTLGSSLTTASSGSGGAGGTGRGAGGAGAVGRIKAEYTGTLSGTTSPAATTATTLSAIAFPQPGTTFLIQQADANTVRLYNYSGSAQNLRLDVITGGLGRNAGTVSLAPAAADTQAQDNANAIWVNQTGINGSLLKLQRAGADILKVQQNAGDAAIILDQRLSGDIFSASASGTPKFVIFNDGSASISGNLRPFTNNSGYIGTPDRRFKGGYFVDGIITGSTSTLYADNTINFGGGSKILDSSGKLQLQAGGSTAGNGNNASIYFLDSSGNTRGRFETVSASYAGSGADGTITVTASKNLNTDIVGSSRSTYADGIAYRVNAPASGTNSITRYSASDTISNGIAAGDEILLINLQGASGDTAAAGTYEFLKVSSITTSTITTATNTVNSYTGTSAANQKVVVQRVPQYTSVTLSSSGSLTASAYDGLTTTPSGAAGYLTGIVAFRATGTVTVGSGTSITVAGKGYRAGAVVTSGTGKQGESRIPGQTVSTAANDGGGGGGSGPSTCNSGAGGGGGYAASGSSGGAGSGGPGCPGGTGGGSMGTAALTTWFPGSGGGSGGYGSDLNNAGGAAGGIVFVGASYININGTVSANGSGGGAGGNATPGGGGGAGGSIFFAATGITAGTSLVTSTAGAGGISPNGINGGNGSVGRIRLEYATSLSGTTNPSASTATSVSSTVNSAVSPSTSVYGILYIGSTDTANADLAEYYISGDKTISAGDVVSISDTKVLDDGEQEVVNQGILRKSTTSYDPKLLGIISTNPGVVLGSIDGDTGKTDKRQLALSGRVPVKIAPDSPAIEVGDFLTSSSTYPGMAMKATKAGYTVGKALESWAQGGPTTIETFVNLGYNMGPVEPLTAGLMPDTLNNLAAQLDLLDQQKTRTSASSLTSQHSNDEAPDPSTFNVTDIQEFVKWQNQGVDLGGVAPPPPGLTGLAPHWSRPTQTSLSQVLTGLVNVQTLQDQQIASLSGQLKNLNLTSAGDLKIAPATDSADFVYNGNLQTIQNSELRIKNSLGETIERVGAFSELAVANLRAGTIQATNSIFDTIVAKIEYVADSTIERLTVNQKVVSPVVETKDLVATGEAQLNTIAANEIKPQSGDLTIDLSPTSPTPPISPTSPKGELTRLIIRGLEGKTAAVIDEAGNATFSGTLTAAQIESGKLKVESLQGQEATISGTLVAQNVQADNIDQLANQVSSSSATISQLSTVNSQLSTDINDIQKLLADIKNSPLPDPQYYQNLSSNVILSVSEGSSGSASLDSSPDFRRGQNDTVEKLTVTGTANLYNVFVTGSLLTGSLMIENNSVISLASDLKLSSLSTITLFNGSVVIAKDGTITAQGKIVAEGGVKTDTITPISPQNDVNIAGNLNVLGDLKLNKYLNATGSGAVIAAPDNFTKNGINAPAIETATTSAGLGILPANSSEIVIYNDSVKDNSLVYLTPTTINSPQLTVSQKDSCSLLSSIHHPSSTCKPYFKVTTDSQKHPDIQFNWLIIN